MQARQREVEHRHTGCSTINGDTFARCPSVTLSKPKREHCRHGTIRKRNGVDQSRGVECLAGGVAYPNKSLYVGNRLRTAQLSREQPRLMQYQPL